jgi:hypothetical protein
MKFSSGHHDAREGGDVHVDVGQAALGRAGNQHADAGGVSVAVNGVRIGVGELIHVHVEYFASQRHQVALE